MDDRSHDDRVRCRDLTAAERKLADDDPFAIHPVWQWVAGRVAGDNPRGDFIRDTRAALESGLDPDSEVRHACREALNECSTLLRRWTRQGGRAHPQLASLLDDEL